MRAEASETTNPPQRQTELSIAVAELSIAVEISTNL